MHNWAGSSSLRRTVEVVGNRFLFLFLLFFFTEEKKENPANKAVRKHFRGGGGWTLHAR